MANFDNDTELTLESSNETSRTWQAKLTDNWSIGKVPNGGYTSAICVRALLAHTGAAAPLSLTMHYYRPTEANADATIRTEVLRSGRTTTHADAVLEQNGKVRVRCVGVFGDYPSGKPLLPQTPTPIPGPDDCPVRDPSSQGLNMTLLDSLDIRLHPDTPLPITDQLARIEGWARFRDGRPNDAVGLALLADAFPPAILSAVPETGWVPTLELTTHIRAQAASGWIRGEITTGNVRNGYLVEDIRLWDSTNTLVVEARQLALLRTT